MRGQTRVEQAGTPAELYERPANRFVAGFLGSPRMNVLPGRDGGTLGVRPEHLRILPTGRGDGLPGTLTLVEYLGDVLLAHVQVEGAEGLVAVRRAPGEALPSVGSAVRLAYDAARAHLFDRDGVRRWGTRQPALAAQDDKVQRIVVDHDGITK